MESGGTVRGVEGYFLRSGRKEMGRRKCGMGESKPYRKSSADEGVMTLKDATKVKVAKIRTSSD